VQGANNYAFTAYVKGDPAASAGAVYTNNGQAFIVNTFNDFTTLVTTGTADPLSSGTLTKFSGTGDATLDFQAFEVSKLEYTKFNNVPATSNNPNPYWTITEVDSTNKTIKFNLLANDNSTIAAGTPGTATKIISYNYRNIVQTGDETYATSLNNLTTTIPPTNEQLNVVQHTIFRLTNRLKSELTRYISPAMQTRYVDNFNITTNGNVKLKIDIPTTITNNPDYFFQVYRTRNFEASPIDTLGVTVIPDQEMRLVYEAFPTTAEYTAGFVEYVDTYPEELRNQNANLYTNPNTGDGINQANDVPPIAKDINRFKNVVFYANTKTRQRLNPLQLIGTTNISTGDSIVITDGTTNGTQTYMFQEGAAQVTRIIFNAPTPALLANQYFNIYSAQDQRAYYIWYSLDNAGVDPNVAGKIGVRVDIATGDIASVLRDKTLYVLNALSLDFIATEYSVGGANGIEVTNISSGITTDATDGTIGAVITITTPIDGKGEDPNAYYTFVTSPLTGPLSVGATYEDANGNVFTASQIAAINATSIVLTGNGNPPDSGVLNRTSGPLTGPTVITFTSYSVVPPKVLLLKPSASITAAQSIDATANSLVKVINKQDYSSVNAYYISGSQSLPGLINLEGKIITGNEFYIQASNNAVGISFTPNIEPYNTDNNTITRISGTEVQFQTTAPHGLINGDQIVISYARVANGVGVYQYLNGIFTVQNVTTNTFRINLVTATFVTAAYDFAWSKTSDVTASNNEEKANRVYYSKLSQPEAVPLLNYFDIGSSDKQILRIFPLRDSLFVFKEDGLYRISGELAPFVVTLFDSSCVLIAPDTVSVANNIIYGWTNRGISNVTEAGVVEVSRPIDTVVLKLASANFPNFQTASWGIGYDSDNSYTVYTCGNPEDQVATVGFRFSNLTNTWTNIRRSQTCGVLNSKDDRLYLGSGTSQIVNQERKRFDRTDYADYDFKLIINDNNYNGQTITFPSILDVEVGDVLYQNQKLTVYDYNKLLKKLDIDGNVGRFTYTTSTLNSTTITLDTFDYNTSNPYAHQLVAGDWVQIQTSNTSPSINGVYEITSVPSPTSLVIEIAQPLVTATTGFTNTIQRNYEYTFEAGNGDNLRSKLVDLCVYLDTDPGLLTTTYSSTIADKTGSIDAVVTGNPGVIQTVTVPNGLVNGRVVTIVGTNNVIIPDITGTHIIGNVTNSSFTIPVSVTTGDGPPLTTPLTYSTTGNSNGFTDLVACYNAVVALLNDPASGTSFKNYEIITTDTFFEAVILEVDTIAKSITINLPIQLISGEVSIYKAIPCKVQYAPLTFGDPLQLKQVYEATIMLDSRAFTTCSASFSSDLKPEFSTIEFVGDGNGIFGFYSPPGFGFGFFGGASNAAPLRTIIPRESQRCRFINVQVEHTIARENWNVFGVTLTFNQLPSTRAYR
jgi:hypothetical protein